jgi:hypothetical protein
MADALDPISPCLHHDLRLVIISPPLLRPSRRRPLLLLEIGYLWFQFVY